MGWTERDLRPIGFFANRRRRSPFRCGDGSQPFVIEGVECIASVSSCIAEWPPDWLEHWTHNEFWLHDSLAALEAIIPVEEQDQFIRYAVAALPVLFDDGQEQTFSLADVHSQPAPEAFLRLGFDTCSRSLGTTFECSPATCQGLATELGANALGLFDSLPVAIDVARSRRDGNDEPGPYMVLEIRSERDPLGTGTGPTRA